MRFSPSPIEYQFLAAPFGEQPGTPSRDQGSQQAARTSSSSRVLARRRRVCNIHGRTWKPRFLGEYDYASGNTRQNLNKINTFDQQYPSDHNAFGLTDLFGFQNIKEERMNLDLTPAKHVTVLIQQEWLQVASRFDNIYNGAAATVVKAPATGFLSGDIGREFDASGKWVIRDYLVMNVGVGHFSPGTVMRENVALFKHAPRDQ